MTAVAVVASQLHSKAVGSCLAPGASSRGIALKQEHWKSMEILWDPCIKRLSTSGSTSCKVTRSGWNRFWSHLVPSGRTWLYLVPVFTSFGGVDANTFAFFIGCLGPERGVLRGDGASGKREIPAFYGHFFGEVMRSHRYCSNSVARAQRSFKNPWFRDQMI